MVTLYFESKLSEFEQLTVRPYFFRLPETAKADLPQDFEDGAALALNKHVCEEEDEDQEKLNANPECC